jgi:predicted TPR repeat methyltransferase
MHQPLHHFHDDLNRLFVKACEDHQNGLLDAAGQGYRQLLDYFFEAPLLHYNLGLVYYQQGEYAMARDSFSRAAELQEGDPDILFNLALSHKKSGDADAAIRYFKLLVQAEPESIDTLYNLAGCYKDTRRHGEAKDTYREVLRLQPGHPAANNNLAYLYHLSGEIDLAVLHYKRVLDRNPEHKAATHMVAALTGTGSTGSPDSYVREIFDQYSRHFEHSLVDDLEYRVPTTIRSLFDRTVAGKLRFAHGLDLGCGTGLSGQAFADLVEVFDGLDLSEKMIEVAAEKKIYRNLYPGSIVNILDTTCDTFDFYLAADVFGYVGDLAETFRRLRVHARPDVLFCFSTETMEGSGYRLQQTGRFAHSPEYIGNLASATGWQVAAMHTTRLRKEQGAWVQGDLWFFRLAGTT